MPHFVSLSMNRGMRNKLVREEITNYGGFVFKYGLKIQNVSCVIFLGGKNKIKI